MPRYWNPGEKWMVACTGVAALLLGGATLKHQVQEATAPAAVMEHTGDAMGVEFSPDSTRLASAGGSLEVGGEIKVWSIPDQTLLQNFHGSGASCRAFGVRYLPGGTYLYGGKGDGVLEMWNTAGGNWVAAINQPGAVPAPVMRRARTFTGKPGVWKPMFMGSLGRLMDFDISPDGKLAVTCGWLSSEHGIWNVATGKLVRQFASPYENMSHVAFDPTGRYFLTVRHLEGKREPDAWDKFSYPEQSGRIHFWSTATAKRLGKLALKDAVYAEWSPNGDRLAVSLLNGVELWKVALSPTGIGAQRLASLPGPPKIGALAWSPDGKYLAGHAPDGITIWDTRSAKAVRTVPHQLALQRWQYSPTPRSIDWSHNGQWLAATADSKVLLWDVKSLLGP